MVNGLYFTLKGADGDKIDFMPDSEFSLTDGLMGVGIPPTQVRIDDSASDGGVWRFTKRLVRDIDLPFVITGSSEIDVETKLRRLSNLLHDRKGATTLIANYPTGETWEIQGHYVGGAETQFGDDTKTTYCKWVVQLRCPVPYWVRTNSEQYNVGTAGAGRGLIPRLAELQLSSSQALGVLNIENSGDVEAYPVWTLRGPATQVTITNSSTGASFVYNAAIALGTTITIDTFKGTVVNQAGTNLYANLGTSPKLFPIDAGTSSISIVATGADTNTLISLAYQPRKEVVH